MMELFHDAATRINSQAIREWKSRGKKIVGTTCSYVPAEIFHAAGILPVRLRGIETDNMAIGDAYFGPYICSFPKCLLQLAGEGRFAFLDGTVITPGCDAMRRLDDCWRKAGEDHPGIVPSFFYYFDVPHKTAPHGMKWFEEEIRNLVGAVERHFDIRMDEDRLRASIAVYNKGRRLLKILEDIRRTSRTGISGADAFAVAVAGTVLPRESYNAALECLVRQLEEQTPDIVNGKTRLMVLGSISDDMDLIRLIEGHAKAVVVAENLCFGVRYEGHEIDETGDPITALAEGYLGESTCPRMYGKYAERLEILKQTIRRAGVQGVVMQNIRFCDLHGSENSLFERDLEAMGIPCLKIEREYGPLVETGRIRMRLDAFMERMM
ncbi:MAG: 2-hydroxyacyl-CoA dehydratase subunit D [Thermodesulfobacteriota bacterium]